MATIDTGTTRLAYDEAGAGPAVVLVHAGVADRRMWDHQFAELARRHRVVRYDWRGHGDSADHEGPVRHHEDLLALMDALGIGEAALVGASFGGAYAVDAALYAPERVSALALVCPGMSGYVWPEVFVRTGQQMALSAVPRERLSAYRAGGASVDPADVAAMAEAQARFMVLGPGRSPEEMPTEAWDLSLLMLREMFARRWASPANHAEWPERPAVDRLHEVGVPTLVVKGLSEVPQVQAVADLYAKGVRGARLLELPETGHLPSVERPGELTAALSEFLNARRPPGGRAQIDARTRADASPRTPFPHGFEEVTP
ncbi:alpha/beta hydrolase [Nocardiopsis terrae]|uniref:Pimeloyl-ACP methyl ester carboxylesterase n=1 Tax=Nocardiopsis terrae TaxID=372655 RepID=A0ABR9HCM8_9ACTN|nr:alpha/beta fold hydrolase [Nocardiopsis terrae]MBE1456771.1 pimeloyl-ACP methyl ester carboxylesterase [Nocardiopsis terrae]GHC75222.1 alpha/beta hydrolase [Nocardiopsis terrae]